MRKRSFRICRVGSIGTALDLKSDIPKGYQGSNPAMCLSSSGGMEDTLVLGTSAVRRESSSLSGSIVQCEF